MNIASLLKMDKENKWLPIAAIYQFSQLKQASKLFYRVMPPLFPAINRFTCKIVNLGANDKGIFSSP